ncbi:hypothetical protein [Anaerocolumna jejuensis]|uniref:hypothetical protein n=1 Tax=Anaerocolumna jejuensis TaxID=259063 RepID=UPI003F7C6A91
MRNLELLSINFRFDLEKKLTSDMIRLISSGYKKTDNNTYCKESVTLSICENQVKTSGVEYKQLWELSNVVYEKLANYNPDMFYDVSFHVNYNYSAFRVLSSLVKPNFIKKEPFAITNISFASAYENLLFFADIRREDENIIYLNFGSVLESLASLDNVELDTKFKSYIINYLDKTIEERLSDEHAKI